MTRLIELSKTNYGSLLKQLYSAGIQAVSEKNWATLKSTAALMEQPSFAILQVHKHIAELKKQLPNQSAEFNAQPYHEIIHWARLTQPAYRKWQAQQIEWFNDPLWWHHHLEQIKKLPLDQQQQVHQVLHELQKTWIWQNAYAHYSTIDIIHVYETVIPVFSEWLHYAKTELKERNNTLTPRLKRFYQNYLTWFEGALAEEKALLRTCMRERLVVGIKKGYGVWDNVIAGIRDELKMMGILPKEPKLDKALAYGHLTPQAFVTIRKIIEQEGNPAEKNALYALTGDYPNAFDKSPTFYQHYRIDSQGCCYFIPPARSDMIPMKPPFYLKLPRFLQQLFWGDVLIYTFFQQANCQFLLAQNRALLKTPLDTLSVAVEQLLDHPAWKQSRLCLQLCRMEYERTTQWLKHILLFFFPSVKTLLEGYQADLKANAENWANQQLLILKEKIKNTQSQSLTSEQKNTINTAFLQLEQVHHQWDFSATFLSQLTDAKQAYTDDNLIQEMVASMATVTMTTPMPSLPAREAFPLALRQVIQLMIQTNTLPTECLAELEAQLATDKSDYDSVTLRCWVENYLVNAPNLSRNLAAGLQAVLDDPKFSQTALDRAENKALRALSQSVVDAVTSQIAKPTAQTLSLWDKNPWDYSEDEFQLHCHALKQQFAQLPPDLSLAENEKLCQYTLRFLKQIYDLTHWDAFVLKQDRINQMLNTLIEVTRTTFALHQTLRSVVDMLSGVTAQRWALSKNILLMAEIRTLENFINRPTLNLFNQEAASYASQAELQFSKSRGSKNAETTTLENTETLQLR